MPFDALSNAMPNVLSLWTVLEPMAQRVCIFAAGALVFVHLICQANFLPRETPMPLWLPLPCGVASAVGAMHAAVVGSECAALWAALGMVASVVGLHLVLWAKGYHVSAYLRERVCQQVCEARRAAD